MEDKPVKYDLREFKSYSPRQMYSASSGRCEMCGYVNQNNYGRNYNGR